MTTANWIMAALVLAGLIITAAGWFIAIGRQASRIEANTRDVLSLGQRVTDLEHGMSEVDKIKGSIEQLSQSIKHHSEIAELNQKLVMAALESGRKLTDAQLDELKHRTRNIAQIVQGLAPHAAI